METAASDTVPGSLNELWSCCCADGRGRRSRGLIEINATIRIGYIFASSSNRVTAGKRCPADA